MKVHLRPLEYILHFYMLVLLSSAFVPLVQYIRSGASFDLVDGDPLTRILLMIGYGLTLPFILFEPRRAVQRIARTPWVWLLVAFALLSVFWSQLPALTLRRAVALILTTLYALALVERFSLQEFLELLGYVFFFMLAFSLLMIIFLPAWSIMTDFNAGAWQGIFVHKNILGRISTIGLLIFSYLMTFDKKLNVRWLWILGFGIAIVALLGSRSTTAQVNAVFVFLTVIGIILTAPLRKKRNFLLFLFLMALGLAIVWILFYSYVDILTALGKNATLTGRIPLWQVIIKAGIRHLWFGWGYSAFWQGWQGPSAPIWGTILWEPPHAHNGYLDLFLDLGVIGLTFGLTILFKSGATLLKVIWQYRITPSISFLFGLCSFFLVYNFTESAFLRQNNILWVLLVWHFFVTGNNDLLALARKEKDGKEGIFK